MLLAFFLCFLTEKLTCNFHIIRSGNTNRLRSSKSLPTKSGSVYSLQVNSLIIYFWFHFYPLLALIELYEDLIIVLFCVVLWSSFLEGIFFLQLELLQKVADSVSSNFKVTILTWKPKLMLCYTVSFVNLFRVNWIEIYRRQVL